MKLRRRHLRWLGLALVAASFGAQAAPASRQGQALVPGGKPVAPIAIDYAFADEPALGRATRIRVSIVPEHALDDTTVVLAPSPGLVLDAPQTESVHGSVAAGQAIELDVSVTPLAAARLRLVVTVTGLMRGAPQARTVSIPIRLGAPEKAEATLEVGADGEVLHSLPAVRPPRGILR